MSISANFISPTSADKHHPHTNGRKKGKKIRRLFYRWRALLYILVVFFIGGIFLFSVNYAQASALYQQAMSGKKNFEMAQSSIEQQNFSEANVFLQAAHDDFVSAQKSLKELKGVKFVPLLIRQVVAIDHLLTAGIQTSEAVSKVSKVADVVIKEASRDSKTNITAITKEQRREVLKTLYESLPDLQAARADLGLASSSLDQIPRIGVLKQIRQAVAPMKEKLPLLQDLIDQMIPLSEAVPQIVGYPHEKTYLFLLENNTELRPGGGFIGSYGVLKVKNGEIASFSTDNVYNLDENVKDTRKVTPPWPFQKYMGLKTWFFRDSNWSPHFPETARTAVQFYYEENGPEKNFDGVIAVTPTFIESLLRLVGNIEVNGVTYTADNITATLQEQVEVAYKYKGIAESERKEIIGDLSHQLVDKLLTLPKSRWKDLWETMQKDFQQKHVLFYLVNEDIQKLVEKQHWDGAVRSFSGDSLMVVDANMASLKSDPGVKRTISYKVEVKRGKEAIAHLDINYKNEGSFSWKSTRYRTYTRVYVPKGSELISYEGAMDNDKLHGGRPGTVEVQEELGKTRFGAFIAIEPTEEGTLRLTYRLPENVLRSIEQGSYQLLVQKQAGTIGHILNVDLDFDTKIRSFQPEGLKPETHDDYIIFRTDLQVDRQFSVGF